MQQDLSAVEPLVYNSQINVPYDWWAGETASRFLVAIRDEKKFLATKCEDCQKVIMPPRKNCPKCFSEAMSWVELPPTGELVSFTVVRRQLAALPKKTPVIFGLIRLDGADTAMLHYLGEVEPSQLAAGMRLKAKFADQRQGTMLDIEYFRPE